MAPKASHAAFRVGVTADFFDSQGQTKYRDMGLAVLDRAPGFEHFPLDRFESPIQADQLQGVNGVIVLTPAVTAQTVSSAESLLAVGRFGVGYDAVDVAACTAADVAVFITAGAVDRSVAEATIGWMLALTHRMLSKDKLVRELRWDERSGYMGSELRDRTFGAVGFGGIARSTVELLRGWGMREPLAYDPYLDASTARKWGVRSVSLDELMAQADFVSVHCPLTNSTRGLIGKNQIALMKKNAYLLNTARGGIVDEQALEAALAEGRIAGAALDCFEKEPVRETHPLMLFENVIFAPHCIAWTDELFRDIGQAVCQGMVDLAAGRKPHGVLNPEVFDRPGFIAKWDKLKAASAAEVAK